MYALTMSKLDEVKEILNTLRVVMSLSFGMLDRGEWNNQPV